MSVIYLFIFIFGTIIGSFLNVVVLRYNTGNKITKGKSKCFSCGKKLLWYELVPVLSFVFQKGKCRSCGSKISYQYPLVEIITGVLFLLIFLTKGGPVFGWHLSFLPLLVTGYWFLITSLLLAIAIYDFRHQIIPNEFVYPFVFLSLFSFLFENFNFRESLLFGNWKLETGNFIMKFIAGFVMFLFFASLWYFSQGRAMGFGDAKLALGIGWLLGPINGFLAFLFSFWVGAIVGIFLLFLSKKSYNIKSKIAFGPFLVIATFLVMFYGDFLIKIIPIF